MSIQLRWIVPDCTTTDETILQFAEEREDAAGNYLSEWRTVPVVIVSPRKFDEAKP